MNYRKDFIKLPKEFPFMYLDTTGCRTAGKPELHFHDCLELNYIAEGSGINYIEDHEYVLEPDDFYIINNLEHHMASTDGNLRMKVIVFDPRLIWNNNPFDYDYLKPFYSRNIHFSNRIGSDNPVAAEIYSIFMKIESEWKGRLEGYKMVIKGLLTELLAILYRYFKSNNTIGDDVVSFHKAYDRIRDVLDKIHSGADIDFKLEELAAVACMNKTYFSSYFKKVMNLTVFEYIRHVRINEACTLLRTTNSTITHIAMQCGFKNMAHFVRVFKEHVHASPTEFRSKNRTIDK